ncbi:ABC transporter substrate-binding protein [Thermotoga sp. 38H-to]|jgi:peptide/nickel transport system substrate-binding protein|uniref:ABC transporter substrate-binding protein n=1 Tax=Thermotoga sp. 38H-to TaxID=1755812 RepID=UPI0004A442C3|nr:ABC transporter substrate-binding protein [Thermotoga sp. 38H-to]KAF2959456.1 peptide ABC transporter [Thermotoga sp. 38H-to]
MLWRRSRLILLLAVTVITSFVAFAQGQEVLPGIPRNEVIIIEDPSGRSLNPGRFNLWGGGVTSWSTGLQQLCLGALWYIDPDEGIEGDPWINLLAAEPPIYNEDYTKMTVKLRKGIYWSDGVPFTADDVVFTVETLKAHPEMTWGAYMQVNVEKVYKTDDYTVVFELKKPNGRFHTVFTVRWSGCYIMPKHIFEKVDDPVAFDFNPPVGTGPYVLKEYDPNGYWFLWELREDWERSDLGVAFGKKPGPKYVLYKGIAAPEKKVMEQMAHNLDIIHDLPPESAITLWQNNPYCVTWYDGWPWAHPDPTLPAIIMNHEQYPFNIKEVRWALALAIDMVQVVLQAYNGCATISPIDVPPTGKYPEWYFDKIEPWLKEFTIKVGNEEFKPYDPTIPEKIANAVKYAFGYDVPDDPAKLKKMIGYGWWKYAPDIAEKLLKSVGFTKKGGKWYRPDGKPWKINILCESATRSVMTRAAVAIAEQWRRFGIDANIEAAEPSMLWQRMNYGEDPDTVYLAWVIETWGGHPDLFWFLESWHSEYYKPTGEAVVAKNPMRYKSERIDRIIDELRKTDFFKDIDRIIELGLEYIKVTTEDMPLIPLFSYNVFTVCDEYYWTGYPTAENPYTNPVPNWGNTRFMFIKLQPTGRK